MTPHRIRLAFNTRRKGPTRDDLTRVAPALPRGYAANIEVCLMDYQDMEDISDISTLTLRVVPIGSLTGTALFTVDLSADVIGEGVTKTQWDNDEAYQARFELTAAQTAQSLGGNAEAYFRFIVTATNTDGDIIPWGYSDVRIVETGRAATATNAAPETYDSITTADSKYQQVKASSFYLPVWNNGADPVQWVPVRAVVNGGGLIVLDLGDVEGA